MSLLFALENFGEQPAASSSQYTNASNIRVKADCAWRLANKSTAVVWMRMKQVIITNRNYISCLFNEDKQKQTRGWNQQLSLLPVFQMLQQMCHTYSVFLMHHFVQLLCDALHFLVLHHVYRFRAVWWRPMAVPPFMWENAPVSLCVSFSFSGSMRGIHWLSLRSRMLYSDVRI